MLERFLLAQGEVFPGLRIRDGQLGRLADLHLRLIELEIELLARNEEWDNSRHHSAAFVCIGRETTQHGDFWTTVLR